MKSTINKFPYELATHHSDDGDRLCGTCNKADVCMYKGEVAQAAKEITQIAEQGKLKLETDIRCPKWYGEYTNRELGLLDISLASTTG